MPVVKMTENGQVTIPAAVRTEISARTGDLFDVAAADGNIVLTPRKVGSRGLSGAMAKPKGVDISEYIGSARGIFGNREQLDEYIRKEREAWD